MFEQIFNCSHVNLLKSETQNIEWFGLKFKKKANWSWHQISEGLWTLGNNMFLQVKENQDLNYFAKNFEGERTNKWILYCVS